MKKSTISMKQIRNPKNDVMIDSRKMGQIGSYTYILIGTNLQEVTIFDLNGKRLQKEKFQGIPTSITHVGRGAIGERIMN